MRNVRYWLQLIFLVLIGFGSANICKAQTSLEFWPETDIWYRLSPSWRFSAFIPITKYNESKYRDLNIYLHVDYSWGKTKRVFVRRMVDENREQLMKGWMVRGFYMKGWSLGENSGAYMEDMLFAEIHKRIPLKGDILLSHRIRTDLRWLGEDSKFSYRFRYRMMLEKEYESGKSSIVPYVNVEPYWDSRYLTVNRVRAIGGATVSWGPRLAYEANVTYQYDEYYDTPNLFALNIILHVFFERGKAKVGIS
jgi:hypothetical protein